MAGERNGTKSPPPQHGRTHQQQQPRGESRQNTVSSNPGGGGKVGSGERPVTHNQYTFNFLTPTNLGEIPKLKSADNLRAALTCLKCMKNVANVGHEVCSDEEAWEEDAEEDDQSRCMGQLTLGLKVYTQNREGVEIRGQLRRNVKLTYADFLPDGQTD